MIRVHKTFTTEAVETLRNSLKNLASLCPCASSERSERVVKRFITWQVTARDEKDLIGTGTHERYTMNAEKFAGILRKKSGVG